MTFNSERLQKSLANIGATSHVNLYSELSKAYGASDRHYHSVNHIAECLIQLDRYSDVAQSPVEIEIAIWFHDSVYLTDRNDNEEKSAEWAQRYLGSHGVNASIIDRVTNMILATKTHIAATEDEKLMLDIDLGVLGASPESFERYDTDIRKEFAWVPYEAYRTGRSNVLKGFLKREYIYHTAVFQNLYEAQARNNLMRKVNELDA